MPTLIPYDPKLVLGNLVTQEMLDAVEAVATAEAPIAVAEQKLNSFLMARLSLDMTIQELIGLAIEPDKNILEAVTGINEAINRAAVQLAGSVPELEITLKLQIRIG